VNIHALQWRALDNVRANKLKVQCDTPLSD